MDSVEDLYVTLDKNLLSMSKEIEKLSNAAITIIECHMRTAREMLREGNHLQALLAMGVLQGRLLASSETAFLGESLATLSLHKLPL